MTPEGRVKKRVNKVLSTYGVWYFTPVSNGMGKHGIPDKICCVPVVVTAKMVGKKVGLFMSIETKAKTMKPSKLQSIQMSQIKQAGGMALLVNEERVPSLELLLTMLSSIAFFKSSSSSSSLFWIFAVLSNLSLVIFSTTSVR